MFSKKVAGVVLASLILTGCSKVPAGYQGVKVTLYGSSRGVNETSLGVGRYWIGINEELYLFPTFLQNYTWIQDNKKDESITMQTQEGLSINTDAGITYNIRPENVVKVFQKYRLGIEEITHTFLRNMVRDAMNKVSSSMSVEQLYGLKKEYFISTVNNIVKKEAEEVGIEIDKIYLIGSFRLPQNVIDSINSKIQAAQNAMKVENEIATAKAEAQKIIITAEAQAEANQIVAKSLTSEFVQYQTVSKWNGQLPSVTGANGAFINLPKVGQ